MTGWTNEELSTIEAADELEISPMRRDGSMRNPTTIWVVRLGNDLYVRPVNGPTAGWFRATQVRHEGWISSGGVEKDVTFVDPGHDLDDEIDDAYRAKYRRDAVNIVGSVLTPEARSATLKLVSRAS